MLLTIDQGNTNTQFGFFCGETLVSSFRLMTDAHRTADEIGLYLSAYLGHAGLSAGEIEAAVICSVVPGALATLIRGVETYLGKRPLVIDRELDPGLPYITNDGGERLGPDRAAADIAAMTKYGTPLVVVDLGTATTVDALSPEGVYLGGCITAGVQVSLEGLSGKTALLPCVDPVKPDTVLGLTAVGQIQAGAVLGCVGAVEYLIRRTKEEMGFPQAKVIATGGLAPVMAESTDLIDQVDQDLVLDGIRIIYERSTSGCVCL